MTAYTASVRSALREIHIYDTFAYSWFGVRFPPIALHVRKQLSSSALCDWLVSELSSLFYANFYTTGVPTPVDVASTLQSRAAGRAFLYKLEEANASSGYCEGGWQVQAVGEGELLLRGFGVTVRSSMRECCSPDTYPRPAPGDTLSLRSPRGLQHRSPGYYLVLGESPLPRDSHNKIVRLYWNLRPDGAPQLISFITRNLQGTDVPYRLKVLSDPGSYTRCDAGVLYIRHCDYHRIAALVEELHLAIARELKGEIPAFTKRLAWGLGYAEEPTNDESFGRSRARLMAEGVVESYVTGRRAIDDYLCAIRTRFQAEGLDLERPFLVPTLTGMGPSNVGQLRPSNSITWEYDSTKFPSDESLSMADAIGSRLIQEAFWHAEECNWLSDAQDSGSMLTRAPSAYMFLGPDLYSGTSGIALFLAELSLASSSPKARSTAIGAIRNALRRASEGRIGSAGLYGGQIGVALAAARIGCILDEDKLTELAEELVKIALVRARTAVEDEGCDFDIIGGDAGSIVALLTLRGFFKTDSMVEAAKWYGARLVQKAKYSARGCSWESPKHLYVKDLTGLAHGAAGASLALLEIYRATADPEALDVALHGFAYEDSWFDTESGNWPDFREESRRNHRKRQAGRSACFWCHGAPGILLTRLRCLEITRDSQMEYHARRALKTTQAMLADALRTGEGSFSLCHGLAGNADVVMLSSDFLGDEVVSGSVSPPTVGMAGIERAKSSRLFGPGSGVEAPGLMHGMAGIGYFYLRLCRQNIPSVLFPVNPEAWSQDS